jgi:hypothetical protein
MKGIKKIVKRSSGTLRAIAGLSYPVIWLLLKSEACIVNLSDRLVRMTLSAHKVSSKISLRLFGLLGKHLSPSRYRDEMAKDLRAHGLAINTSLAAAIYMRYAYSKPSELPEFKINPKSEGIRFARAAGMVVAKQFQGPVSFNKIIPIEKVVIKPENGYSAHGVFIVKSLSEMLELNSGKVYNSWDSLLQRIQTILYQGVVQSDSWIVEEYVSKDKGNIANDLKFNVFYGVMGWVAEMERHPSIRCYMMHPDGKELVSKLYSKEETFLGRGATQEEMKMVEKLSLQIPVPFMRIDFLRGSAGLVFDEFTPRPGIIGYFDKKWDQLFGQMFYEAEARLRADLVAGKKFELFNSI